MEKENKYTVIELSDKLQVPRTTITDWLARYASFIDFKIQGKRKVYTDKSIEVLLEIKELRDKGLSSFDIEEELAKRHPLHGEFSNPASSEEEINSSNEPDSKEILNKDDTHRETGIVRQNNNEMAEMLKNMLLEMTRRMDELEKQNRINLERNARWNILSFVVIILLVLMSVFGILMVKNLTEEKEGIDKEKREYISKLDEITSKLKDIKDEKKEIEMKLLEIDGERKMQESELQNLQKEIIKQKEEFENVLKNSIRESEQAKEAELLQLRDKFAEEKLLLLKEIEKVKEDKQALELLLAKIQAKADEQATTLEKLLLKDRDAETEKEKNKEVKK